MQELENKLKQNLVGLVLVDSFGLFVMLVSQKNQLSSFVDISLTLKFDFCGKKLKWNRLQNVDSYKKLFLVELPAWVYLTNFIT